MKTTLSEMQIDLCWLTKLPVMIAVLKYWFIALLFSTSIPMQDRGRGIILDVH